MDVFTGSSPVEVEERFSDRYWYKRYKILNVIEIPEIDKGKGDGRSDSKRM